MCSVHDDSPPLEFETPSVPPQSKSNSVRAVNETRHVPAQPKVRLLVMAPNSQQ